MRALILIDLQIDFCPGGALEVAEGDLVLPLANQLMSKFELVVATQDWHPANHGSFAANHPWRKPYQQIQLNGLDQTLWPIHCVQNSFGARFAPSLQLENIHKVVQKGTDPDIDSYSGFFDNGKLKSTELHVYLQNKGVTELYVLGLATDYCVKFTVLDALDLGYKTYLVVDACRGVNLQEGDVDRAIETMQTAGAHVTQTTVIQ
ncbi:MAG: bifunctional nicotinamidase/pyrazinamidase [Saprospiraceae bacterium]